MVLRNYGIGFMLLRHVLSVGIRCTLDAARKVAGAGARLACSVAGLTVGLILGTRLLLTTGAIRFGRIRKGRGLSHAMQGEPQLLTADAAT